MTKDEGAIIPVDSGWFAAGRFWAIRQRRRAPGGLRSRMALWKPLALGVALCAGFGPPSSSLGVEGRVELDLFIEERVPLTGQQDWLQQLAKLGVTKLRIHAKGPDDKVGVEVRGTESSPIYVVRGAINSNNDLVLPGGRYSLRTAGQAAKWLSDLARKGPAQKPEETAAFGLTPDQFEAVRFALSRPVGFATQGAGRAALIQKLAERIGLPVKIEPGLLQTAGDDPVADELSGLSGGTAMACVLRPAGLCLVPRRTEQGEVECVIVASQPKLEVWPIGWESKKTDRALVPAISEKFKANVQNVSVTTVLDALAKRLKAPFLLDHNALARHGIDPQKTLVSVPPGQTTYNQLLRGVLSQAKLKSELRVDEAGKPFFWVTTVKKL